MNVGRARDVVGRRFQLVKHDGDGVTTRDRHPIPALDTTLVRTMHDMKLPTAPSGSPFRGAARSARGKAIPVSVLGMVNPA